MPQSSSFSWLNVSFLPSILFLLFLASINFYVLQHRFLNYFFCNSIHFLFIP